MYSCMWLIKKLKHLMVKILLLYEFLGIANKLPINILKHILTFLKAKQSIAI